MECSEVTQGVLVGARIASFQWKGALYQRYVANVVERRCSCVVGRRFRVRSP